MYKILLHKNATKFYNNANVPLKEKINRAVDIISQSPHYNIHIKKLKGEFSNMYRYRMGDIRIIYEIHEEIKTARIKTIETRGSAYK